MYKVEVKNYKFVQYGLTWSEAVELAVTLRGNDPDLPFGNIVVMPC